MRWIRVLMYGAVTAVAVVAAVISYSHIHALAQAHGGLGAAPALLPLSVDGEIVAASMLLLHEARSGRPEPPLARAMLILGVVATVAANVAFGAAWGLAGAVIWMWPAIAFVGSVELLIILVRRAGRQVAVAAAGAVRTPVPADAETAAAMAYEATWAAGNPYSQNQLIERFGVNRTQARAIRERFMPKLAGANGDGS